MQHSALGAGSGLNTVIGEDVGVDRHAQFFDTITGRHTDVVVAAREHVDTDAVTQRDAVRGVEPTDLSNNAGQRRFKITGHRVDRNRLDRCQCRCAGLFGQQSGTVDHLGCAVVTAISHHGDDGFGAERDSSN